MADTLLERFGTAQTFTGPVQVESYGNGTYAAYDTESKSISTVNVNGVKTALTGDIGYGNGFDVLSDNSFLVYGLSNYGQDAGAAARIINADGTARTDFFNAGVGDDLHGGVGAAALTDGGFVLGGTSRLHASDPVTFTYPYNPDNFSSSATVGRGGDVVGRFFDGTGTGGDFALANTDARSYAGASAPNTVFEQRFDGVVGLANGKAVEVFHDYIAVGINSGGYNRQDVISLRILSKDGSVSANVQVNNEAPTSDQFNPATYAAGGAGGEQVVSLGDQGFAVVWHEGSYVADSSVYGGYRFNGTDTKIRYFDLAGDALTGEIQLVHRSADLGNLSPYVGLDTLGDGRIALVFQDGIYGVNGSAAGQMFVSVVGTLGSSVDTTAITPSPLQGQSFGGWDVASLGDGGIAVSFSGPDQPYGASVSRVVTFGVGQVIEGHDYGETLNGGFGPDKIYGFGGNDTLKGGEGSDTLEGGGGTDTAVYAKAFANYTITGSGGHYTVIGEGTDTLSSIEKATFSDGTYDFAARTFISQSNGSTIVSYYDASGHITKSVTTEADGDRITDTFNAAGTLTYKDVFHADTGNHDGHYYAITGKAYATQDAVYDSAFKLLSMERHYASGVTSFTQLNNPDGTSEVHNYDTSGRETLRITGVLSAEHDVLESAYSGAGTTPIRTFQTHYGPTNTKQWTDQTNTDGSHIQTSLRAGTTLASHAGVADSFVGFKGGADVFVFDDGFGKDKVSSFSAGSGAGHDILRLNTDLAANFAAVQSLMTKVGNDTLITFDAFDSILVKGIAPTALTADNFQFVHQDALLG